MKSEFPNFEERNVRLKGGDLFLERIYKLERAAAALDDYALGGNYPAHIGEVLANRYVLLAKARAGAQRATWLAYDCRLSLYVSVHIYRGSPLCAEVAFECVVSAQRIAAASLGAQSAAAFYERFQNAFVIDSARGRHIAVVCEALGASLRALGALPADILLKVARESLRALAFLHCEARTLHGGVRPEALRVCLEPPRQQTALTAALRARRAEESLRLAQWQKARAPVADARTALLTKKQKRKLYKKRSKKGKNGAAIGRLTAKARSQSPLRAAKPNAARSASAETRPSENASKMDNFLLAAFLRRENWRIKLCDFSAARRYPLHRDDRARPRPAYCPAPESLRGAPPAPAADVWALGCAVWDALAGAPPFADAPRAEALALRREVCAALKGKRQTPKTNASVATRECLRSLSEALRGADTETRSALRALFRGALTYASDERPSASQLLAALDTAEKSPLSDRSDDRRQRRTVFNESLRALFAFVFKIEAAPLDTSPCEESPKTISEECEPTTSDSKASIDENDCQTVFFGHSTPNFERLRRVCDRDFLTKGCLPGFGRGKALAPLDDPALAAELGIVGTAARRV